MVRMLQTQCLHIRAHSGQFVSNMWAMDKHLTCGNDPESKPSVSEMNQWAISEIVARTAAFKLHNPSIENKQIKYGGPFQKGFIRGHS